MHLTEEQQALLNGEKGEVMAKIVKTLVMYGDTFGAEGDGFMRLNFGCNRENLRRGVEKLAAAMKEE